MQCCGEPFEVGDDVQWTAEKWTFGDPGIPGLNEVDLYYENHGDDGISVIFGKVKEIFMVYRTYKLDPAENKYYPDLGKIVKKNGQADGWEESQGEYRFSAYFVCLENVRIESGDVI